MLRMARMSVFISAVLVFVPALLAQGQGQAVDVVKLIDLTNWFDKLRLLLGTLLTQYWYLAIGILFAITLYQYLQGFIEGREAKWKAIETERKTQEKEQARAVKAAERKRERNREKSLERERDILRKFSGLDEEGVRRLQEEMHNYGKSIDDDEKLTFHEEEELTLNKKDEADTFEVWNDDKGTWELRRYIWNNNNIDRHTIWEEDDYQDKKYDESVEDTRRFSDDETKIMNRRRRNSFGGLDDDQGGEGY